MSVTTAPTTIHDLPDVLLSNILASISDTRTRNAAALVCHKWRLLERATRTRLTLRGDVRDPFTVPTCFRSVTHLDLSLLSPWGHSLSLSLSTAPITDPSLLAHCLRVAFPSVTSLTIYARSPSTLSLLTSQWPSLSEIKLVRWHQRPQATLGADFFSLFEHCCQLKSMDLSCFYCWTEDLPPALEAYPQVAQSILHLNLLNLSFAEGFKAHEIQTITAGCPNLQELLVACTFDPRYIGFVGDDALLSIPSNCKRLRVLQLVDISSSNNGGGGGAGDFDVNGFASEDAGFSRATLINFFGALPLIEELVLDVRKNVRDSGMALEVLATKCPNLKSLKLGHFHGLCMATGSQLDGIALCQNLECLSITNSADLTDFGLIAIARGCSKLAKFEIEGCKKVTMRGIRTMASLLRRTLVDVKISCCDNLDAAASIKAVEPIRDRIQRLHIDCIWDSQQPEQSVHNFDLNNEVGGEGIGLFELNEQQQYESEENCSTTKRLKFSSDLVNWQHENITSSNSFWRRSWERLEFLSLWIPVGELLTPLETIGLEHCPNLEEIHIKVEGDCRERPKPAQHAFGLSTLTLYPKLWKMKLDCGDTIGFALTAPFGHTDLGVWERFFLNGIETLSLEELDYWPPSDREVNQRTLALPAVALLQQCYSLRKLFIHGTAHEHFLNFLLKIENLRDMQLREDYYPAPENDMSTEMRVDSCCRFEDALNKRRIPD
ncbi:F-box/LRR-repeat MAX2 A [Ancistrocladus abbreviatus]